MTSDPLHILVLAAYLPWHGHGGGVLVGNLLRELSKRHDTTLISYAETQDEPHIREVRSLCSDVRIVKLHPPSNVASSNNQDGSGRNNDSSVTKAAKHIWRDVSPRIRHRVWDLRQTVHETRNYFDNGYPDEVTAHQTAAFESELQNQLRRKNYDIVVVEWAEMIPYGLQAPLEALLVFDSHELRSLTYWRRAQFEQSLHRKLYWLSQSRKMRRLEAHAVRSYDLTTAVSMREQKVLAAMRGSTRVIWNPIGVDVHGLAPQEGNVRWENALLFIGNMARLPNQDAVRYFLDRVYPAIRAATPDVRFFVVGGGVPQSLQVLDGQMGIRFVGYVPDLKQYLHRCAAFVLPVRQGAGIKIKAMEAMAASIPIVTTAEGSEGIDFISNDKMLVAGSDQQFAELVIRLVQDKALQERLARGASQLAHEHYDYFRNVSALEEIYHEMLDKKRSSQTTDVRGISR